MIITGKKCQKKKKKVKSRPQTYIITPPKTALLSDLVLFFPIHKEFFPKQF